MAAWGWRRYWLRLFIGRVLRLGLYLEQKALASKTVVGTVVIGVICETEEHPATAKRDSINKIMCLS